MNRRQEIADVIGSNIIIRKSMTETADAVLDHLAAPVELKEADLEALPDLSVVMDDEGDVWQKRGADTWCGYEVANHSSTRLARFGPFLILHIGKADS